MPPVQRVINVATGNRVIVDVFDLLPHHLIALNLLGMTTLLPNRIGSVSLVPSFFPFELSKQRFHAAMFKAVDNSSRSIGLEDAYVSRKLQTDGDQVKMVFEDDIGENLQPIVLSKPTPRVIDNLKHLRLRK